ncbi:hypothetical protein BTO30_10665 [Domibacillus antri]|uniref:Uncharacterized protein YyaB-like PH domain-containing protein n=1 Tax=Domibacillus antri TaxID=1714264 RepID=A0A1Q8Q4C1_9BACI|nr:PH domain-containing protein [Domibacillus antri]OLN22203.1 hypothetical protein BTO30_10665 [Domibacillus antri]
MYFPTKKDLWIYPISAIAAFVCLMLPFIEKDYFMLLFTAPPGVFMVWSWFKTGYEIGGDELTIYSGPIKKRIPIHEIRKTKRILSSPALSMDRLEISYSVHYHIAVISPIHQTEFVRLPVQKNSGIQLDERLK